MDSFVEYINASLPDNGADKILYKFKRKTLEEMTERANEVTSRGITDRKVTDDLIISEHPDLKAEYKAYYDSAMKKIKGKRNAIMNAVGSVSYILLLLVAFFGVSFSTGAWNKTWAIIPCGILLWVVYLLSLGVVKFTKMKRIFHIFARVCLAGAVINVFVSVFLAVIALTDIEKSWLIVIAGLIALFVADGIYAVAAKHRLAIINWLIYIPVIAVFAFIFIGALGVLTWNIAWIIIPLSLILDFVIIIAAISKNKLEKMEVADTWNEN